MTASVVLPLLRLLFLKDYARRREFNSEASYARPLLHVTSTFLSHASRLQMLFTTLREQETHLRAAGLSPEVEFWGAQGNRHTTVEQGCSEAVTRILNSEREVGGRAVLRASKRSVRFQSAQLGCGSDCPDDPPLTGTRSMIFHISFSLLTPHLVTPATIAATAGHESLILHAPRSSPVPVTSTAHLKLFLSEQVAALISAASAKSHSGKQSMPS